MATWIFPYNKNKFRLDDLLSERNTIEWGQRKYKVETGDIVFLYSSAPDMRITHKMVIEKINLEENECFNDKEFETKEFDKNYNNGSKFFRMKFIKKKVSYKLLRSELKEHGLKSCMQGPIKIDGELLDYIEKLFE